MELSRRSVLRTIGAATATASVPGVAAGLSDPPEMAGDDFEEREWGYVRSDFEPPEESLPSALMMDGYKGASSGESPTSLETGIPPTHYVRMRDGELIAVSVLDDHPLAPEGAALVWASARGTGCSGGTFDLFDRTRAFDGYELVEWVAEREWAIDRVGLFGASYSAILSIHIASTQPPSLAALSFSACIGDLYRGAVMPGGVPNPVFPALWTQAYRRAPDLAGTYHGVSNEDELCAQNVATREPANPTDNPLLWYTRRTDGNTWRTRSAITYADRIEVPTYISHAWQDEQTGPRGGPEVFQVIDPDPASPPGTPGAEAGRSPRHETPKLLRTTNGKHGSAHSLALRDAGRWFRYWLLGEETGIMEEARVRHHFGTTDSGTDPTVNETGHLDLEEYYDVDAKRFYLGEGGYADTEPPESGTGSYLAAVSRDNWEDIDGSLNGQLQTVGRPNGPDVLIYRTPAFETPHVIAGPITATLFVQTTAPETDFFVQICDESEAGVVPLQRGLLRASFRTLNEYRTVYTDDGDVLRPYRPHESTDPVVPGETNRYDVEVFPVAHILRPGHKLQIRVSAPPVTDGLWGYEPSRTPSLNTLEYGEDGSRLVVPIEKWPEDQPLPEPRDPEKAAGYRVLEE
jgi:putative CocE/NonD family hydrolase